MWLITFEPHEQKQIYIPLLKVLVCGINAQGPHWNSDIFILRYTSLKMAVLLHKTALVNFPMATTVCMQRALNHKIDERTGRIVEAGRIVRH